jgi:5-methylcytosine-specific restriction endonuclease McrBC regulatory subunit McrC
VSRIVYENEPFDATPDERAALRRLLGSRLEVDGASVRIVKMAGHVVMPDKSVLQIRSRKATAASLLAWVAYADPAFRGVQVLGSIPKSADAGDLASTVSRAFCVATVRALEQSGLLRAYTRQQVRTATIRGRIDFARMAQTGGDLSRTPCTVFTRLPHTPLNRLLAAALELIRRDPVMREGAQSLLAPLTATFADVPPGLDRELLAGRRPLTRLEQPFGAAFALAKLIVRTLGLLGGQSVAGLSFLFDLATLFEQAVVRALSDAPCEVIAKHPVRHVRRDPTGFSIPSTAMALDVFIPNLDGRSLVVDAKYKTKVASSNLQQMVAYCWLTGARTAALVFPSGQLTRLGSYTFPSTHPGDSPIEIHLVELELGAADLRGWERSGANLVRAIAGATEHLERRPDPMRIVAV